EADRAQQLLELIDVIGSDDRGRYRWLRQQPGKGYLRRRSSASSPHVDHRVERLPGALAIAVAVSNTRRPSALWRLLAAPILAGQESRGERTVGNNSQPYLFA